MSLQFGGSILELLIHKMRLFLICLYLSQALDEYKLLVIDNKIMLVVNQTKKTQNHKSASIN